MKLVRPLSSLSSVLALLAGCTWETDLPGGAKAISIDARRELLVTDDGVVSGPLARNATNGPLSFRHAAESLPLEEGAIARWLQEHHPVVASRWRGVDLDPAATPFRLVAVANRTDLAEMPDRVGDGGEGRLVFALTDGPADDPASPALPVAVIFEYAQHGSAREWAERWHALGGASERDFPERLVALTEVFLAAGAIAQIRTADASTGAMILRQYHVAGGAIADANVRNTPDWSRVSAASLRGFVDAHSDAIAQGTAVLPEAWWAPSSSIGEAVPAFVADVPQHDAILRQTCAGCHAESPTGFHVDPRASGDTRLSPFMGGELARRTQWMQLTLSKR